jgi:septal ring factor EnvC (AmiA/AmiB activator)
LSGARGRTIQYANSVNRVFKLFLDSAKLIASANNEASSVRTSLNGRKDDFKSLSEELYKRNDDVTRCKHEIVTLENQIKIAGNNQETLETSLQKLKAKSETYRVRSAGAVCLYDV